MTADPTHVPGSDVAVLPADPLPEPWYCTDRRSLECDLCRDTVDALWLLSPHRPPDIGWGVDDGELCICRRRAEAVRPVPRPHQPISGMNEEERCHQDPRHRHARRPRRRKPRRARRPPPVRGRPARHQSLVEAWIAAAGHKLHQAVLEHFAAVREQEDTDFEASPADTLGTRELPERRRTARDPAPATQKGTLR